MKKLKKGFILLAVMIGFVLNGSAASSAAYQRYVDDIAKNCIITKNIPYSKVTNYAGELETLNLDIYEAEKDTAVNRPVVIWIHGGNMQFGKKEDYQSFCTKLAKKGYVVIPINYRVNANAYANAETAFKTRREAYIDVESAIKWVKENADTYGMDANNIIIGGHSAGAEIVDNLYYDDYYYPEIDRTGITACIDLSGWNLFHAPADKVSTIGNPNTKCLVIHGKNDDISPIKEAEVFAKQIGDRGVIKFLDNHNHFWNGDNEVLVINMITKFLKDNITFAQSEQATTEEGAFFQQIKSPLKGYTLYLGNTKSVSLKELLPEASDKFGKVDITYASSNQDIAKVNSDGIITAKSTGTVNIMIKITLATGQSKIITKQVIIKEPDIMITTSTFSIKKGKTFTFKATTYGLDSKNTVWSTSKKSILTIDKKTGKAKAISKGEVSIIVKNGKCFDTLLVNVE